MLFVTSRKASRTGCAPTGIEVSLENRGAGTARRFRGGRKAGGRSRPTAAVAGKPVYRVGGRRGRAASALDDVDRQTAAAGFLVLVLHVAAGVAHGLDDLVEADAVLAVALQRHATGVDGFHRAHRVAFDAGDLHQAADRVAGEAEVVFHADLGRVLDLHQVAAERGGEAAGSHRAGHPDFALAADFGAGD